MVRRGGSGVSWFLVLSAFQSDVVACRKGQSTCQTDGCKSATPFEAVRDLDLGVDDQFDARRFEVVVDGLPRSAVGSGHDICLLLRKEAGHGSQERWEAASQTKPLKFLRGVASAKVWDVPQILQGRAHAAWMRRWSSILHVPLFGPVLSPSLIVIVPLEWMVTRLPCTRCWETRALRVREEWLCPWRFLFLWFGLRCFQCLVRLSLKKWGCHIPLRACECTIPAVVPEPVQVKELQTQIDFCVDLLCGSSENISPRAICRIWKDGCATAIAIFRTPWSSEIHHWSRRLEVWWVKAGEFDILSRDVLIQMADARRSCVIAGVDCASRRSKFDTKKKSGHPGLPRRRNRSEDSADVVLTS